MVATGQSSQRKLPRLSTAAVAVFVVLAGAALIAFRLTRRVESKALSKHLAEAMNCTVTAESTAGKGTTLTFELSRVEGPIERHERNRSAVAEPVAPSAVNGRRQKVLYIEDNLSNLKLVERILARRDDVEVVSAIQGRLGVELARQHQPTLVLPDLHLPDVNGEEILRRPWENPVTSAIPVVIVTADATAGQVQRLMSAGATAYLTKPIDVSQLIGLLDQALTA